MLKAKFSKLTAWIGILTGILGVISVAGPVFFESLGIFVILTSASTAFWFLLAGFRLLNHKSDRDFYVTNFLS